jgi:peptide/nickel transport system substrate-binding protein
MSKKVLKMGWLGLIILALLMLPVLPACTGGGGGGGGGNPTIPYNNPGIFVNDQIPGIDSLDPAWAYDTGSGEQIQYMYDTLVFENYTSTTQFKPLLADGWVMASNGSQMSFHIRPGVNFSDGNPVTAADVAYSIQRVMIQDRGGGPAWMIWTPLIGHSSRSGGVPRADWVNNVTTAVQVVGGNVTFNFLPGPYSQAVWLQILSQTWSSVVEKSWCLAHGEWDGTANNGTGNSTAWTFYNRPAKSQSYLYNHAMGAGPWQLSNPSDWNPGVSITLHQNPWYWQGLAPFTEVVTKYYDDWSVRKLDLQNGNADLVYVPRNYINQVVNWTDLNKYSGLPDLTVDSIFFNFNISADSPYVGNGSLWNGNGIPLNFFQDANVRKAFCQAFDYQTYNTSVLMGEANQMANPIVEGLFGYDPNAPKYSYCLTIAKQLLQTTPTFGNLSSNVNGGAHGGFTFTMLYNSGNIPRKTACEMLQAALLSIDSNFHINIQATTWATFLDLIFAEPPMTVPMFQIGWLVDYPDPDDFIAPYMEPETQGYAWSQMYGNANMSAAIDLARPMDNNATRLNLYHWLEQVYYNDAPSIILFQTQARRFFTKYIHGFYFNPVYPGQPGPLYYMTKSNP